MKLKNSLASVVIWLGLMSSGIAQDAHRLKQLEFVVEQAPEDALDALLAFERRLQPEQTQLFKGVLYLQLRACLRLQRWSCAREQATRLLSMVQLTTERLGLLQLALNVTYQQQDYHVGVKLYEKWRSLLIDGEALGVDANPQLASIHTLAAHLWFALQQDTEAEESIRAALKLNPNAERFALLQALLQRQKKYRQEQALLETLLTTYPDNSYYWERLAHNYYEQKRYQEALAQLSLTEKSHGLSSSSLLLLSQLLLQHGNAVRATMLLEQHPELDSYDAYAKMLLQSYLMTFQRDKALQLLRQYVNLGDVQLRAQLLFVKESWHGVLTLLEPMLAEQALSGTYWQYLVAMSHYELGHYSTALKHFEVLQGSDYDELAQQWCVRLRFLLN